MSNMVGWPATRSSRCTAPGMSEMSTPGGSTSRMWIRPGSSARTGATFLRYRSAEVDQHAPVAQGDALAHGLGAERAEERGEHAAGLERPDHGHVQPGHPPDEAEHPVTGRQAETAQPVGERRGPGGEIPVRDVHGGRVLGQAAQGDMVATAVRQVPVDRLVRDVQSPGRQAVEPAPGQLPGERRAHGVVVVEMGWHPQLGGGLVDHSCLQVTGIHASAVPAATGATLGALVPPVQRPPRGATDRPPAGCIGRGPRRGRRGGLGARGGPGRARTDDLPGVSGLRYQLRYGPAGKGTHRGHNHQSAVRTTPRRTLPDGSDPPGGREGLYLPGGSAAGRRGPEGAGGGRRAGRRGRGSGDLGQCCAVVVGVADVTGAADDCPPHDALTVDHE